MIITFDTSILVRATTTSKGPARRVVNAMESTPNMSFFSSYISGEVGKVLSYPRMQALFGLSAVEIHGHVKFLRSISRIVEPRRGLLPVVLLDPHDDAVLYTAVKAGADVLWVMDRHFRGAHVVGICERERYPDHGRCGIAGTTGYDETGTDGLGPAG